MMTTTCSGMAERPGRRLNQGFTLVELMVSTTLAAMMMIAAMGVFVQQRWAFKTNQIISETQQNVRTAMEMVARDIRMAGYGLDVNESDLSLWLDWAQDLSGNPVTMNENPKIVDGGSEADSIWIAGGFEPAAATTIAAAANGSTTLTLGSGEGAEFNTTDKKVIFIGKCETARITSVSGDILTISTHPTSSRGLRFTHGVGTQVELIKIRSYEVHPETHSYPNKPYLTRDDSIANSFQFYWQRLVSAGVEDMQLSRAGDEVNIQITGKASVEDRNFHNGENGTKYRRIVLESAAALRNQT